MQRAFLIGEKVYLRAVELEDKERCLNWINDPEVRKFLLVHRPVNEKKEVEWLENAYDSETGLVLAIVLKDGDKQIGNCGLHDIDTRNRKAEFGIMIGDKDEWSKGYGTEAARLIIGYAFNTLNMHRIYLRVFAYNERAKRSYEKLGFIKEGIAREDHFFDGQYYDATVMSILENEWRKNNEKKL